MMSRWGARRMAGESRRRGRGGEMGGSTKRGALSLTSSTVILTVAVLAVSDWRSFVLALADWRSVVLALADGRSVELALADWRSVELELADWRSVELALSDRRSVRMLVTSCVTSESSPPISVTSQAAPRIEAKKLPRNTRKVVVIKRSCLPSFLT